MTAGFTCPVCGAVSPNPQDIEHGYCGLCHDFTGAPLPQFWVLNEQNEPMPATIYEWGMWRQATENHVVALTEFHVAGRAGPVLVSTVFLGLDHNYGFAHETRPILFETLVRPADEVMRRYCTWAEAEAGHKEVVAELMARYVVAAEDG